MKCNKSTRYQYQTIIPPTTVIMQVGGYFPTNPVTMKKQWQCRLPAITLKPDRLWKWLELGAYSPESNGVWSDRGQTSISISGSTEHYWTILVWSNAVNLGICDIIVDDDNHDHRQHLIYIDVRWYTYIIYVQLRHICSHSASLLSITLYVFKPCRMLSVSVALTLASKLHWEGVEATPRQMHQNKPCKKKN